MIRKAERNIIGSKKEEAKVESDGQSRFEGYLDTWRDVVKRESVQEGAWISRVS